MAEYGANGLQTINPGESAIFTDDIDPCERGLVRHRAGTGNFLLSGWVPSNQNGCNCACKRRSKAARYLIDFGGNIAVPTGEMVGEISLAITIDGATVPSSQMIVTPAAVEEYFNVSRAITLPVWNGCCQTVTIRNTSDIPILLQNANILFTRPDLTVTY